MPGHTRSSAATAWRQNRAGSLSPASSDSQATGRWPRRAQSASRTVLPYPAGAQTSTSPRPSPSSSRSASRGRGTNPAAGRARAAWWPAAHPARPRQPPAPPPRAAQSSVTCTLTASSHPSCGDRPIVALSRHPGPAWNRRGLPPGDPAPGCGRPRSDTTTWDRPPRPGAGSALARGTFVPGTATKDSSRRARSGDARPR